MSKKSEFVDYVKDLIEKDNGKSPMSDGARTYWDVLINSKEIEKPLFTNNGKLVLKYLKTLPNETPPMRSKDIAEGLGISSRSVSGAMRKLVTDEFVEKISTGDGPVLYFITEKGKNIEIND